MAGYYGNPYGQPYGAPAYNGMQQFQQAPIQAQQPMPFNQQRLNGRMIQSPSDVMPSEVPMDGSVSYFPMQNGQSIVAKQWDASGNLLVREYALQREPDSKADTDDSFQANVLARLDGIENVLANFQQPKAVSRRTNQKKIADE